MVCQQPPGRSRYFLHHIHRNGRLRIAQRRDLSLCGHLCRQSAYTALWWDAGRRYVVERKAELLFALLSAMLPSELWERQAEISSFSVSVGWCAQSLLPLSEEHERWSPIHIGRIQSGRTYHDGTVEGDWRWYVLSYGCSLCHRHCHKRFRPPYRSCQECWRYGSNYLLQFSAWH